MTRAAACVASLLLPACLLAAETLDQALLEAKVPTRQFAPQELSRKITSYAVSKGDPFLLAYYIDDGSGVIRFPLHVVRYDRATGDLRRAELRDVTALFQPTGQHLPMSCVGSALRIREHLGAVYIETHSNPSAGCVIVLSPALALKTALSGWLLGFMAADYAIVRESEVHFMSVQPLHVAVLDLRSNRSAEVYPYQDDPERRQFSGLLVPHISQKWCVEHVAQCDPANFDVGVPEGVVVNDAAGVFGFVAQFDSSGFGPAAEKQVAPRRVAYVFRMHGGVWEHRQFGGRELEDLLNGLSFEELSRTMPERPFRHSPGTRPSKHT